MILMQVESQATDLLPMDLKFSVGHCLRWCDASFKFDWRMYYGLLFEETEEENYTKDYGVSKAWMLKAKPADIAAMFLTYCRSEVASRKPQSCMMNTTLTIWSL